MFGLEAALVDHSSVVIPAIEASDRRSALVEVAGPAALLIAKIHKIAERVEAGRHESRPVDKDAADVYRLLQVTSIGDMALGVRLAISTELSRPAAELAMSRLDALFGRRSATGVRMAARAIGVAGESPDTIADVLTAYSSALIAQLQL